jgi:hypothetical protein
MLLIALFEGDVMRRNLLYVCGVATALVTLQADSARAQTTAVGPYYASPSWDQTFACTAPATCPRFIVLTNFNSEAVLDRETGLVWERSPSEINERADFNRCGDKVIGGREGWRLPNLQELRSLIDPSRTFPSLPDGHPFLNIHFHVPDPGGAFDLYWSSTDDSLNPGLIRLVNFGEAHNSGSSPRNAAFGRSWCVRGGQPAQVQ